MQIIKVKTKEQIKIVVNLADTIWRQHYSSLLSKEQIDYMLENFQSYDAITNQISRENYQYFLIETAQTFQGFFAIIPKLKEKELFLSKIYIKKEAQGKGYGRQAVSFMISIAKKEELKNITLTVNRGNTNSICAYEKIGFKIIQEMDAQIGEGFVMNDYKMSLEI
ncbi:MAG: GNAT family N-acetyltransferase [Elusimicrobiota bacterium]|jgi:RimJ/RimL family protein N-acetyltransferase|nr:GNAT family N-acetyltransferase [Elusimicrobiota bacterium]